MEKQPHFCFAASLQLGYMAATCGILPYSHGQHGGTGQTGFAPILQVHMMRIVQMVDVICNAWIASQLALRTKPHQREGKC